jgi:hypothetical protein
MADPTLVPKNNNTNNKGEEEGVNNPRETPPEEHDV